jgi:hypothetical protein
MAGNRDLFAVSWSCPRCGPVKLVVSPLGPLHVHADTCVHCGAGGVAGSSPCPRCSFSIAEVLSRNEMNLRDDDLLPRVQAEFLQGTCRVGLAIANYVLRRNPDCAWALAAKRDFVEHLDANGALVSASGAAPTGS